MLRAAHAYWGLPALASLSMAGSGGAADMLGYETDELLGASMHQAVHYAHADGASYDAADCPMRAAFQNGVTHHIDGEVLWRKDGTAFPVEYSATPISHDGNLVGAVVVFHDIIERKRSEDTLRTAKLAAEEATRAKGALLANIKESEEQFRTLVANIPGTRVVKILMRLPDGNISAVHLSVLYNRLIRQHASLL